MSLKEKLTSDLKTALKARDELKLSTIRSLQSGIKYKEIELRRELDEGEIISLIATQIKKNTEAAELFDKGGRADLSGKERKEIGILTAYLPEQASEEDLRLRVREVITETEAQGAKDLGKVMKILIPEFRGKADSNLIKSLAMEYLNS
ncbi:MAG: glutamyl-tRNA amidotransferase [Nitrospinae bacterium CG11_big_fil_rev_8_21_14_0_20_56_8]|nr:MAG: glutamyl-tRNA amidotransferase [Nitrospinae bacterium CG11_big_fil_rev_8_21_14_0_20_56_8]